MRTIESEAYKPPSENYDSLARSWHLRDAITEPGNFDNLPQIAEELGFQRVKALSTRRHRHWQIYDRPNHDVPNFPDGSAKINSTLALYDTDSRRFTHAILRTSSEPYSPDEFARDLDAFTRNYIERPRLLGFPSQELTRIRGVIVALAAGTVLGSAADYYTIQSIPGSVISLGSIIGELGGPAVYGALWKLSERHARRQIPNLGQYTSGDTAQHILLEERYHNIKVAIQGELYKALREEGANLTPDQFLDKIYGQIPHSLIIKRHAEVEQAKYPKLYSPKGVGSSLPQLIQVSYVLQQVEAYLNAANELKRGLAQ